MLVLAAAQQEERPAALLARLHAPYFAPPKVVPARPKLSQSPLLPPPPPPGDGLESQSPPPPPPTYPPPPELSNSAPAVLRAEMEEMDIVENGAGEFEAPSWQWPRSGN